MFIIKLSFDNKIKIIQFSPSLIPVPLIRDGIFILIAKLYKKQVVIFYRGWKTPTLKIINSQSFVRNIFNAIFQNNTLQVVLSRSFKKDLENLNSKFINTIRVTTTAIDKKRIIITNHKNKNKVINVLFLGRVQDLKGVEEIIEAIRQLNEEDKLKYFNFTIAGHENKVGYISKLMGFLDEAIIANKKVNFPGRVLGIAKYELYAKSDIFLLPSYTEGCPNSLLEALASGLFCITTPVGAMKDLIDPKKNGLFVQVMNHTDIVKALNYTLMNYNYNSNRLQNAKKYSEQFDIKQQVRFFDELYQDVMKSEK